MSAGHQTPAYTRWKKQVLAQCEPICIRCGYDVDMTLSGRDPMGPSADHEPPMSLTGDIAPGLDGSGISHMQCNRSHGARLSAAITAAKKNPTNKKPARPNPFSKPSTINSRRPLQSPPEVGAGPRLADNASYSHATPRIHADGYAYPRLETRAPNSVAGSYGDDAAEWLDRVFNMQLFGWQKYALDRALEYDDNKELVWSAVIITVARQSGKSFLSRAVCMWRLHHADLFGEPQTILHVANKRSTAMEVMRPAGLWAAATYGKRAVKWGNEAAGIELPTGDRWLIHAANDSAGVGYSCSMIFVDEAWKVKREVVEDSLVPTMAMKNQGQLFLISTAGDSTSDLMQAYRQRALDRLEDPEPGSVLLLEWSAPAEADPDQVDTWRWGSPAWDDKREAFVRQQWHRIEESAFRREYLNMWVIRSNHWLKESYWNACLDPLVELPTDGVWSVAVECDFDGMGHAVAIAAPNVNGHIVVRVTTHRTIAEVDEQLRKIRALHPSLYIQVTPGYVDRIREKFDDLVGQREAVVATQILVDLFSRLQIRHDGSQILQEHFGNSTISQRQGGWVITAPMGRSGIYAGRAVMFAVSQASKTPRSVAMIRSRRPRRA